MPQKEKRVNSILIVSASEQFDTQVNSAMPDGGFIAVDKRRTATLARRALLDKKYDIVIINAPLTDEMGYDLALDICEEYNTSVIIATPPELYDAITDYVADAGVMVILKPFQKYTFTLAVKYLIGIQERFARYEEKIAKTESLVPDPQFQHLDRRRGHLLQKSPPSRFQFHGKSLRCSLRFPNAAASSAGSSFSFLTDSCVQSPRFSRV